MACAYRRFENVALALRQSNVSSKRSTFAIGIKGFRRVKRLLPFISIETLQAKGFRQSKDEAQPLAATISDVFEMLRHLEKAKRKKSLAG